MRAPYESTQESGRLQLGRDLLHRFLDVGGLAGARADELAAPEQEDDDLGLLQAVDEAGELLRLVLRPAEGEGDRLQVQLAAEGGRCDDVLDLKLGQGDTSDRPEAWVPARSART